MSLTSAIYQNDPTIGYILASTFPLLVVGAVVIIVVGMVKR
jgi:hypothetical protein